MIPIQYLQACAAILWADCDVDIAEGRLSSAVGKIEKSSLRTALEVGHACGHLCLLLNHLEEAEDWFRKAGKTAQHSPEWACRAAGLLALFRGRLESALSCFEKLSNEAEVPGLKFEALVVSALLMFEIGAREAARSRLETLACLNGQHELVAWSNLAAVISQDFRFRARLHAMPALADDILWKTLGEEKADLPAQEYFPAGSAVDALLDRRLAQLRCAEQLCERKIVSSDDVQLVLRLLPPQLTAQAHRVLHLELAQAALAAGGTNVAEILLRSAALTMPAQSATWGSTDLAAKYCLSKLCIQQGRYDEGFDLYRAFAAGSMQFLRAHHALAARHAPSQAQYAQINDDISARLPPKYRRAYQYMAAQIHRHDLSIAEVAQKIGVTERALQLAFKESAGISPREALRRMRMSRIHEELANRDSNTSLMAIAGKYGIQNRSSLASGYRRYFDEPPSETVVRNE